MRWYNILAKIIVYPILGPIIAITILLMAMIFLIEYIFKVSKICFYLSEGNTFVEARKRYENN